VKVLFLGNFGAGTGALVRMLQACTQLEVLEVTGPPYFQHDSVTGAQFEAITRYGTSIRALRVFLMEVSMFQETNLLTLCQMPNLSHLNIGSIELFTDNVWEAFAACPHLCANLRVLELPYLSGTFSDEALCTFLGRLSGLKKLDLTSSMRVNDEVLRTVSHLTTLQELSIVGYSNYSDRAIIALAEGCPALRSLHIDIDEQDTPFTSVVQHLWQLLRPQLVFNAKPGCNPCGGGIWANVLDVTREQDVPW
jgi:hypothetical protein